VSVDGVTESIQLDNENQLKMLQMLVTSNYKKLLQFVSKYHNSDYMEIAELKVIAEIENQAQRMCSEQKNPNSLFRLMNIDDVISFKFEDLEQELKKISPLVLKAIRAIGVNHSSIKRNSKKNEHSLLPGLMNATNTLLMCRNKNMNKCQAVNSMILRKGDAEKTCIDRFSSMQIALSYCTVLDKQLELGNNLRDIVNSWVEESSTELESLVDLYDIANTTDSIEMSLDLRDDTQSHILDESFFDKRIISSVT